MLREAGLHDCAMAYVEACRQAGLVVVQPQQPGEQPAAPSSPPSPGPQQVGAALRPLPAGDAGQLQLLRPVPRCSGCAT